MSVKPPPDAVQLTAAETNMLALRLCIDRIDRSWDWLEWEDVPLLDEAGFDRTLESVRGWKAHLDFVLNAAATADDVDPADVWERVR
jgi:hypothetical protein